MKIKITLILIVTFFTKIGKKREKKEKKECPQQQKSPSTNRLKKLLMSITIFSCYVDLFYFLCTTMQIRREFGSFDKYLWGFVNYKPISTNYKSCRKIPVKTSKSETMSKDMVRRGFRYVGPTVMHSFMQAAGLTNDHLITCPRHLQCNAGAH